MQVMKHCGATTVPRIQLDRTPTVPVTQSHNPYNHSVLPNMVQQKLKEFGWLVSDFDAGVSHAGKRAFWLMDIVSDGTVANRSGLKTKNDMYALSIGGRSCWDKTFASGIAGGDHTFVCDNLMLVGEFKLNRKHTTHNLRDLPGMVHDVISQLSSKFHLLIERNNAYMERKISIVEAENIIFDAFDRGAVTKSKVTDVRENFISPKHKDFELENGNWGNIWKLKQAFTEVNKGAVYGDQLKRGEVLTDLLDMEAGVHGAYSQEELAIGSEFVT